ncbi:hypothetical protein ID866_8350 [Astraeus odoratus]|nr:hypothetical protein ID866_8350 [Astraeus odoratus]
MTSTYLSAEPPPTTPRQPKPINYLFAFDVSFEAIESGLLRTACDALLRIFYGGITASGVPLDPCFPRGCGVGILTFDQTLHFYNLSPNLSQASLIVLADLEEVFVPLRDGMFVDPYESRTTIEGLLSALWERHNTTTTRVACLGAALIGGLAALAGHGGHVVVFQSTMPTIGPGALEPLIDESQMYGTEKERTLFLPRDRLWRDIAEECAEEGIGVTMFLGMSKSIDIGSIGIVPSTTGGDTYFHPRFKPSRDEVVLASQLRRLVTRTTAYNCIMRIRCSHGLRISKYYGNFHERFPTDVELGVIDADKAITAVFEHTRTLDEREANDGSGHVI